MKCPCQSGSAFDTCCEPYLSGRADAPTAEALMRARYSACAVGYPDYMFDTHLGAKEEDRVHLHRNARENAWFNLMILDTRKGMEEDNEGQVTFVAAFRPKPMPYMPNPPVQHLHERSSFEKIDGKWLYTTGEMLGPYRPGRNDPCWCGSGKKFKQCCQRA